MSLGIRHSTFIRHLSIVIGHLLVLSSFAAVPPRPPPDWRIELVAEAPDIRHPSVVCSAPDGRVFVAEDPMDISRPANASEGRIICFHPDGRRTVFAEKLYAVFGMQYLEGKLYVLHNPKFSVFTDQKEIGKHAGDLIESTHPNPWALDWNDHVPANFKLAMDGYFYVAVGDKGLYGATGRDGRRVDLHGGGIVRIKPDGTGLEVYATGVRNILDVALNSEDEIFTYDNTDEHNWMGRLTHMVDGGFYGYPYDFVPRRPYTLWMMADFGAGAATGAFAYTEDALPADYHDNLFLADFGKRQILRVKIARDGGTYRVQSREDFFQNPPEDFRPVGICLSADGKSIFICDWAHRDTKDKVEVGRLWKVTYTGQSEAKPKPSWYVDAASGKDCQISTAELIQALSHPSKSVRLTAQRKLGERIGDKNVQQALKTLLNDRAAMPWARWHALWAVNEIIPAVLKDPDPTLRRQVIRFAGTLPTAGDSQSGRGLPHSKSFATSGPQVTPPGFGVRQSSAALASSVIQLLRDGLSDKDTSIAFAVATALGRIGDANAIPDLLRALDQNDLFARFAAFTALNRIGRSDPKNWSKILRGLESEDTAVREGTSFALRETYDLQLVNLLATFSANRRKPTEGRQLAVELLASVHRKLPNWKGEWWAYHPALASPPKKSVTWAGTDRIETTIRNLLRSADAHIRKTAIESVAQTEDAKAAQYLLANVATESDVNLQLATIKTFAALKFTNAAPWLANILRSSRDDSLQCEALLAAERIGGPELTTAVESLVEGNAPSLPIRAQAIAVLGRLGVTNTVRRFATHPSPELRREAIKALGQLRDRESVPALLAAWQSPGTREDALRALARISDLRAIEAYMEALASPNPAVREDCRKSLAPLRDQALPGFEARAEDLKPVAVAELRKLYDQHPRAKNGPLFAASTDRPADPAEYERSATANAGDAARGQRLFWNESGVACFKCHSIAGAGTALGPDLTQVGAQFSRREIIEHILYPSRAVREGYAQVLIELDDEQTVSGLVRGEDAETLSIIDAGAELRRIPKRSIRKRSTSNLSLMPEGLHTGLSLQEFADLVAYLESLKKAPP